MHGSRKMGASYEEIFTGVWRRKVLAWSCCLRWRLEQCDGMNSVLSCLIHTGEILSKCHTHVFPCPRRLLAFLPSFLRSSFTSLPPPHHPAPLPLRASLRTRECSSSLTPPPLPVAPALLLFLPSLPSLLLACSLRLRSPRPLPARPRPPLAKPRSILLIWGACSRTSFY